MTRILNRLPNELKLGYVINPDLYCCYEDDDYDSDDEDITPEIQNKINNRKLQEFSWKESVNNNRPKFFVKDTFDTSINLVKLKETGKKTS
jgi:hypothetical protein